MVLYKYMLAGDALKLSHVNDKQSAVGSLSNSSFEKKLAKLSSVLNSFMVEVSII